MKKANHPLKSAFRNIALSLAGIIIVLFVVLYARPYLSPYFTNQGLQLVEKKKYNEAMFFLNVSFFLHPTEYRVLHNLGRIYFYRRLYSLAIEKLKPAITVNPYFIDSYRLLSQCYQKIGRHDLALETLTDALQLEPYNREVARSIEKIKKEYVADQINKAAELYAKANIDETKSTLQKASELSGDSLYNLFLIENSQPQQQDIEEQITKLERLSRVEENITSYRLIANMLIENHDFRRAIDYYRKCLNEKPNSVALHNNFAVALFLIGQFENAIKEYRIALSFQPDNIHVIYGLARSYIEVGWQQEAKNLFLYLAPASSDIPYVYLGLAAVYKKQGDAAEARKNLEKAIDITEKELLEDKENPGHQITLRKAQEELKILMNQKI